MVGKNTGVIGDRVGDFVNQLKNASAVNQSEVSVSYTKMLHAVAETLRKEGYLSSVEKSGKDVAKSLTVEIAKPIKFVRRHSKPSRRLYVKARTAPLGKGGRGITVLSTPKGIMTSADAKKDHVGGEILFTLI